MTRFMGCLLLFSLTGFCFSLEVLADEATHPNNMIPLPAEITWQEGKLPLNASFRLTITGINEPRVEAGAKRFTDRIAKRTGNLTGSTDGPTLTIECKAKGLSIQSVREDESYDLTVTPKGVSFSAANPLGTLHGLETLLQLVEKGDQGYSIPCVAIHDKPRFPWRGLLIDVCRHWMPVEVIKRNLDGLAEAKMNVFHWHLSENQGFRVESKLYPKLQEMGSDGNFYTQEQIKEIIVYARDRGIRGVPEFDIPGHTTAWFVGYPGLAAAPGPYEIERKFGVFDPAMDPSKDEVYKFLDGFIGEMAGLFPDEYFHIGGDEVNGKQWNQNPEIQRFMARQGLKTNEDLQAYFNQRLEKILAKHHKKMMGWDEVLSPDIPKDILVQSWRGAEGLADAAKKGYDTILSNGYYLDLALPASVHYAVDPIPAKNDLTPAQKSHILGGEACMWSEFVRPETVDSRIWPRTLAVAERLWSPLSVQDLDDLYRRMEAESPHLEELGLTHRSNYLPMLKRLSGDLDVKPLKILADVVEPLKHYQRHRWGAYNSDYPLDRLADAARPESDTARSFRNSVDSYLKKVPSFGDFGDLIAPLESWKENHKALEPLLQKSDLLVDVLPQSQDLSSAAQVGLEAIHYLKTSQQAPASWQEKVKQILDRAQEYHAEVQIAVIPAIRKLVLAAGQLDKLKGMSVTDWNKSLDDQVESSKPKDW